MRTRPTSDTAPAFREAIAQWHLAARTAVKRSSSLPTTVFDACDPMLEARLAESVQQLMEQLQGPPGQAENDVTAELRLEVVTPDEMARLYPLLTEQCANVEIHTGQTAELLCVLLDLIAHSTPPADSAARHVLREQFGITEHSDIEAATTALHRAVTAMTTAAANSEQHEQAAAQITVLCEQIVAAALVQSGDIAPTADNLDGAEP